MTVDMANLGVSGALASGHGTGWALGAPLVKKCAILAVNPVIDQRYTENYDECCAMLRRVTECVDFTKVYDTA
jgi:hypothetical protein